MSKTNFSASIVLLLFSLFSLLSCNEDPEEFIPDIEPGDTIPNGAFVSCEGSFGSGNASVSFYNYQTDSTYNTVFHNVNDRSVGDVLQSITVHDTNVYLAVNNSSKVEIVNAADFAEKGVITGVSMPRYLVAKESTGYISCWGDNSVKIVDLNSNEVAGSITTASGPDKMIIQNDKLYIANSGGWGVDSLITVVNLNTNQVIKNIEVKYAPVDLVADPQGDIWVLCFGKIIYGPEDPYPILEETASKLYKIDTETDLVVTEQTLFDTEHPMHLEMDNSGVLYFGGGYTFAGIYSLEVNPDPEMPVKIIDGYAYGLNINPYTNELFVTYAPSYTSAGILTRYSTEGLELGSYECGISPNGCAFIHGE